jgi:hypothetical protein
VAEPAAVERGPLTTWSFDEKRLTELADEHRHQFSVAQPFPHIVLDGLFPEALLADVSANFPAPDADGWQRLDYEYQRKLQWIDVDATPAVVDAFIGSLQSRVFLTFVEKLTGVAGLIADPHLFHGGMHQIETGGHLQVHTDQLFQPELWLYRRVNVIVYLNPLWDKAWGGHLQLWNHDMTRCAREIEPLFNRTVILHSPGAYHGHPEPTTSPPGICRQSVALYYYTSPDNPTTPTTTREKSNFVEVPPRWRRVLTDVTPPIVKRGAVHARSRIRSR